MRISGFAQVRVTVRLIAIAFTAMALAPGVVHGAPPAMTDAEIFRSSKDAVVFLSITARKSRPAEGERPSSSYYGSGVLVSKHGHILTARHLFPPEYDKFDVIARMGEGATLRTDGFVALGPKLAPNADIALLQLPRVSGKEWPCVRPGDPWRVSAGDHLMAIGFPFQQDLSSKPGNLESVNDLTSLWTVTISLAQGMSGGPVLDNQARLVALVTGGLPGSGGKQVVEPAYRASSLILDEGLGVWQPESGICGVPQAAVLEAVVAVPGQRLSRDIPFSVTQAEHQINKTVRPYEHRVVAQEGFRIVQANFDCTSCNNVDAISAKVRQEGAELALTYQLTSGPFLDRWRGWLEGVLHITEERVAPERVVPIANDISLASSGTRTIPEVQVPSLSDPNASISPLEDVRMFRLTDGAGRVLASFAPGTNAKIEELNLRVETKASGRDLKVNVQRDK